MSVTKIRPRRVAVSEPQILKARYDEARAIKDAWDYRLKRALSEHYDALHHGGGRHQEKPRRRRNPSPGRGRGTQSRTQRMDERHTPPPRTKDRMTLKRPPSQDMLSRAAQLLSDGASQREVQRTTGIARETIRKHFPGKGWTYREGGDFRALTKDADERIRRTAI